MAGDFYSWEENLIDYAWVAGLGLILLLTTRVPVDYLILPKAKLSKEIAEDKNVAAAVIEGGVAIGIATILVTVL